MRPASSMPEQDLHFVLCDFGRSGQAYTETDPTGSKHILRSNDPSGIK
jgi:hypothetical protein